MQFQQPRAHTALTCDLLGRVPGWSLHFLAVTFLPLQETAEQLPELLYPEITSGATHLSCSLLVPECPPAFFVAREAVLVFKFCQDPPGD